MYINIIALLDSIKDLCQKQSICMHCPFALSYTHENESKKYYYCALEDLPDKWQIDTRNDDAVFYKIERSWLRNER